MGVIELADDTQSSMTVAYYLGNDWVFACPLPLSPTPDIAWNSGTGVTTFPFIGRYVDICRSDYYLPLDPLFNDFNQHRFSKYYGEQWIYENDNDKHYTIIPEVWTTHKIEHTVSMCSRNLTPSYERLYVGEDYFEGFYANGESSDNFDTTYKMKTTDINLDVDKGFYGSHDLAQTLTNKLHIIDGQCDHSATSFVPSLIIKHLVGVTRTKYNITDNVSKTFATTSALDTFFQRELLVHYDSNHPTAMEKREYQRRKLYRNILTSEPQRVSAIGHLYNGIVDANSIKCYFDNDNTPIMDPVDDNTQFYNGFTPSLILNGPFGVQIVVNDFLPTKYSTSSQIVQVPCYPHDTDNNVTHAQFDDFPDTFPSDQLGLLDLKDGDVVWTNLVASETNLQNIKNAFNLLEHPDDDGILVADIDLARADDARCFSNRVNYLSSGTFTGLDNQAIRSFNLLSPPVALDSTGTDYKYRNCPLHYVYPVQASGNGSGTGYTKNTQRRMLTNLVLKPADTADGGEYYTQTSKGVNEWGYRVRCKTRFEDSYLPVKSTVNRNSYKIVDPNANLLQMHGVMGPTDSKGNAYNHARIRELDLGCVVGFRQSTVIHGHSVDKREADAIKDVPFIGFVYHSQRIDIPTPSIGEMMGISRSFADLKCAKIASVQKETSVEEDPGRTVYDNNGTEYVSTVNIGAANMSFKYNDTLNKMTVNDMHTPLRTGQSQTENNNVVPAYNYNDASTFSPTSAPGAEDMVQRLHFSHNVFSDDQNIPLRKRVALDKPWGLMSAQSGVGIVDITVNNVSATSALVEWTDSLWSRIGFEIEDLLPKYMNPQLLFNNGMYTLSKGARVSDTVKYVNQVRPLTTNGAVSADDMVSLTANACNLPVFLAPGSVRAGSPISISHVPDFIVATNNPSLYTYSHLVVYSDILVNNVNYIGSKHSSNIPAVGYVTKSYVTGNFIYGQESPLTFTVDKAYQLSEINVDIRLPDGRPANIDPNSSVIFRIIKQTQTSFGAK